MDDDDFIVILNDHEIKCNREFVNSNFPEFYRQSNSSNNKLKIQIEGGDDFYEVTKCIFQGTNYEITNDNFDYLLQLSQKVHYSPLQTKLNSFCYKRECNDNQIDQHPSIQFLIELSSLINKLSLTNYEDISSQIKQKLMQVDNFKKAKSNDQKVNTSDTDNESGYDDDEDSEDEIEKSLSITRIGDKNLNKLFYFEIVNTLSTGFNSTKIFQEHQKKIEIIIHLIKELDLSSNTSSEKESFLNNFLNYVIQKYKKIKDQTNSLSNYKKETLYIIHFLLSNKLIKLQQICENDEIILYFLEFYSKHQIKEFFSNNEQIVNFLSKANSSKTKSKAKAKKNDLDYDNLVQMLSKIIKNGFYQDECINIFLNDDIEKFKKEFNPNSLDSYTIPAEISDLSCLSALNNCSLIELAAFFGSQNIFHFLNEKRLKNEIKGPNNLSFYVIIGQSSQIIKLFLSKVDGKDKNSIFEMQEFCIDHHFNETYDMIKNSVENYPKTTQKELDKYMKRCVSRGYFDMVPLLLKEGANTNVLLNLFCKNNNEIGIEYMLEFSNIDVNTLYNDMYPLEYCINNKNSNSAVLLLKNDYINMQAVDEKFENDEKLIHVACRLGLSKVVSYLLRKYLYDVNLPTNDGICPIHYACLSGNYDTVLAVIRTKKVHIRAKVKNGDFKKRTALHFACCSGNPKIITLLINSDEKLAIDSADIKGRTPIIYAIKGDFVDCIYVLLEQENGIDINQEYKGNNLLQYACLKNKSNVFDAILNSIVFDPNQKCQDGRVILVVAIENRNAHIVRSILDVFKNAVNVNIDTNDGKTPLIIACELGEFEIVKLLLNHDLISTDKPSSSDGFTPFMAAARSGNLEILQLLNDGEIDIYAKNNIGMSAIHFAFFSQHIEAVNYLLPLFNDKLNERTSNGETLFQIACKNGKVDLAKILIDNPNVDVNVRDNQGMTAFLSSVKKGNVDLVKALIESHRCILNEKTNDGMNAFLLAVENQNLDLVKLFIEIYANNNKSTKKSKRKNAKKAAQVANDDNYSFVDINEKNTNGKTALFIALKSRNKKILQELISCPFVDINETCRDRTFLCKVVHKMVSQNYMHYFNYNAILNMVLERKDLDLNKPSQKYENSTCLHIACKSSNHQIKLVNKLLKIQGIDINAKNQEGTPLFLLIKYQYNYFNKDPNEVNRQKDKDLLDNMTNILKNNSSDSNTEEEEENSNNNEEEENKNSNSDDNENKNSNSDEEENENNNDDDENENSNNDDDNDEQNINETESSNDNHISSENNENSNSEDNFNSNDEDEDDNNNSNSSNSNSISNSSNSNSNSNSNSSNSNSNSSNSDFTNSNFNSENEIVQNDEDDIFVNGEEDESNNENDNINDLNEEVNYWCDFLDNLKLDLNKGGESSYEEQNRYVRQFGNTNSKEETKTTSNVNISPLELSITRKYSIISNALISKKGININYNGNKSKRTPLHLAILNEDITLIKSIISIKGLNVNLQDEEGNTPLLTAIKQNSKRLSGIILDLLNRKDVLKGINYQNINGESPFLASISNSDNKIFNKLMTLRGIKLDCQDNKGRTAFYLLIKHLNKMNTKYVENQYKCILEFHEACPSLLNVPTKSGKTPLFNSILNVQYNIKQSIDLVLYLLDQEDIDLSLPENILKEEYDEYKKYQLLLKKNKSNKEAKLYFANHQKQKIFYTSLLHAACSRKVPQIIEKLIPLTINYYDESDVNIFTLKNEEGNTILNIAIASYDVDSILSIIEYVKNNVNYNDTDEFDINTESSSSLTPLHSICKIKQTEESLKLFDELLSFESLKINAISLTEKRSALHYACSYNNDQYVEKLIDFAFDSIDPNICDINNKTPLMIAILNGNKTIVELLLKLNSIDINLSNKDDGETSLYLACENSNADVVSLLINDERTEVNCQIKKYLKTPLIYLVEHDELEKLKVILTNEKVDLNIVDNKNNTALHYACINNNKNSVDELINFAPNVIDPNICNESKKTPLLIAVFNNQPKIVKRLLRLESIKVNLPLPITNKTPLYVACEQWNFKIVSFLLNDERTDPNCREFKSGKTALMYSIENFRANLVDLILSNKRTDINITDNENKTAFHYACKIGNVEFIKEILNKKNEIDSSNIVQYLNAKDKIGFTPLHYACMSNNKDAIMYFIKSLSDQIDINICDKNGLTPFDIYLQNPSGIVDKEVYDTFSSLIANKDEKIETSVNLQEICDSGHFEKIKFMILNLSFDVNCNDNKDKMTLLHMLCRNQKVDLVNLLLSRINEVDINCVDINQMTPLHHAVKSNFNAEIVKLLFSTNKCDLNAKDKEGRTALHYACNLGKKSIIEEILKHLEIIDINEQDNNGSTALHDIADSPLFDIEILKMLLKSNCNPNIANNDGNTPIHLACLRQNNSFVSSLIELSPIEIDINIFNKAYQTPLFIACMKKDFIIFDTLFSSKLSNKIDINLTSPIYIAAMNDSFDLVEKLLEMPEIDLNSNKNNFKGFNLLHIISSKDKPELLKKLIETNQFDINELTDEDVEYRINGTPLIIALKNNNIKNVYLLLEYYNTQLDLSPFDSNGLAAIHYCIRLNDNSLTILQELIKIDDRIINMETNNKSMLTPLMIAFQSGSIDYVNLLLQQPSIDVFFVDNDQNTIFHFAAKEYQNDIIDFVLMKIKSSSKDWQEIVDYVNLDNNNGETALFIACEESNTYVVKSLIDTFKDSLDFTICNTNDVSPFIAAIKSGDDELIHLLLLNEKCMSNIDLTVPINEEDDYIAFLFAENQNVENFKLLIQQTLNHSTNPNFDFVNSKNKNGDSLLSKIIDYNNIELFNYICETQNADLNICVNNDQPLIFTAVEQYDFDWFKSIFINGDFPVNSKFNGQYLLHYAAESHNDAFEKVKFLIGQEDVDVNCVTDKGGFTPLHLAVKNKNSVVVNVLLSLDDKIDVNIENSRHVTPRNMAKTRDIVKLFVDYDERNNGRRNES